MHCVITVILTYTYKNSSYTNFHHVLTTMKIEHEN